MARLGTTLCAAVVFLAGSAFAQREASFVVVPGVQLNAVSADGDTAVGWTTNSFPPAAVRWTRASGVDVLRGPGGQELPYARAYGVSWDGRVIAGCSRGTSPRVALAWIDGHGAVVLPGLPGVLDNDVGTVVSGNGRVIAGFSSAPDPGSTSNSMHVLTWDEFGMHNLDGNEGSGTWPTAASFGGEYIVGPAAQGTSVACYRWSASRGREFMAPWFLPLGANADATVIVGTAPSPDSGFFPAVLRLGQGVTAIPGAGSEGRAYGISADGRTIVGVGSGGVFIWDSHNGTRPLRTVASEQLGHAPGILSTAVALAPDGRTIVGLAGGSGYDSYILRLRAPCAGDVDDGTGSGGRDGLVDGVDLTAFIDWMLDGDMRADLDDGSGTGRPDAAITLDDLLYFIQGYVEGC